MGFEGIHMDTYGLPKHVWDAEGRPVELAEEFPGLIAVSYTHLDVYKRQVWTW